MVIGQQKIVAFFEQARERGRMAQAYYLIGPAQVGKRTLATFVASKLLSTAIEKLGTHPDFCLIGRQEDEKTGKLKKEISVAQARSLRERWSGRPWLGGYQVVIINEADFLSIEAANALLKVLEEPSAKSILFLLAEDDESLLPTIRSRAQLLYLPIVSEAEISNHLEMLGCPRDQAGKIARLSWGRPGRAIEFWRNPNEFQAVAAEVARYEQMAHEPFYLQLQRIEDSFGDKDDAIRGRDKLISILNLWIMNGREKLLQSPNKELVRLIDQWRAAQRFLRCNVHPRLVMEHALLAINM